MKLTVPPAIVAREGDVARVLDGTLGVQYVWGRESTYDEAEGNWPYQKRG